jgi:hypothetical protein
MKVASPVDQRQRVHTKPELLHHEIESPDMLRESPRATRIATALVLVFALFSGVSETISADAVSDHESWQVMYLSGQRIGYGRVVIREVTRGRDTVYVTDTEERVSIRRFGQQLRIQSKTHTEETEDGQLLSFNFEMKNPPAQSTHSAGRVEAGKLVIDSTVGGRTQTKKIDWDPSVKSPAWQDRSLSETPLKPGESRSFKTFMPEFSKVVSVKIAADDYRVTKLHDGTEKSLLQVRVSQSILPGIGMRVYLDQDGEALRTEADLLGMVTYSVSREVALQQIAGAELDMAEKKLSIESEQKAETRLSFCQTAKRSLLPRLMMRPWRSLLPLWNLQRTFSDRGTSNRNFLGRRSFCRPMIQECRSTRAERLPVRQMSGRSPFVWSNTFTRN